MMSTRVDYRKLSVLLLLCVLLYNEVFTYWSAFNQWPTKRNKAATVLLVADPQLQGSRDEPGGPVGWVTRWDSDRFLAKTFAYAANYYHLDAVVFLGDLIDEGSTTPNDEVFESYVSRFRRIYPLDSADLFVYSSGDNDIGGEDGADPVTQDKVKRFNKFFPNKPRTKMGPLEFVSINILENQMLNETEQLSKLDTIPKRDADGDMRIIISHIPITASYSNKFMLQILQRLDPDLIFSAHFHHGMSAQTSRDNGKIQGNVTFFRSRIDDLPSNDKEIVVDLFKNRASQLTHEIVVPTCSYRMGERNMAFGLATFDLDPDLRGKMTYVNLWLPKRFPMLYLYAVSLILAILMCLCGGRTRRLRGIRRGSNPSKYV